MASEVDWSSLGNKKSEKGKLRYLKVEPGQMATFRPVGKPCQFVKFYVEGAKQKAICLECVDGDAAAARISAHLGQEIKPQVKYAINVIDRADQQVKILEFSAPVAKAFAAWEDGTKNKIGSMAGGNWSISCSGAKPNVRYTATYLMPVPLTAEELARVNPAEKEKSELYKLSEIYKGVSIDEMMERMFGDGPQQGYNSSPQHGFTSAPKAAAAVAAVASGTSNELGF